MSNRRSNASFLLLSLSCKGFNHILLPGVSTIEIEGLGLIMIYEYKLTFFFRMTIRYFIAQWLGSAFPYSHLSAKQSGGFPCNDTSTKVVEILIRITIFSMVELVF